METKEQGLCATHTHQPRKLPVFKPLNYARYPPPAIRLCQYHFPVFSVACAQDLCVLNNAAMKGQGGDVQGPHQGAIHFQVSMKCIR